MTIREKLIEILKVPIFPHEQADPAEVVADYLLDNGVTFATENNVGCNWIPVSERLPEEDGDYLVVTATGKVAQSYFFKECDALARPRMKNVFGYTNVTHWMPLPEPPKEV